MKPQLTTIQVKATTRLLLNELKQKDGGVLESHDTVILKLIKNQSKKK